MLEEEKKINNENVNDKSIGLLTEKNRFIEPFQESKILYLCITHNTMVALLNH